MYLIFCKKRKSLHDAATGAFVQGRIIDNAALLGGAWTGWPTAPNPFATHPIDQAYPRCPANLAFHFPGFAPAVNADMRKKTQLPIPPLDQIQVFAYPAIKDILYLQLRVLSVKLAKV